MRGSLVKGRALLEENTKGIGELERIHDEIERLDRRSNILVREINTRSDVIRTIVNELERELRE